MFYEIVAVLSKNIMPWLTRSAAFSWIRNNWQSENQYSTIFSPHISPLYSSLALPSPCRGRCPQCHPAKLQRPPARPQKRPTRYESQPGIPPPHNNNGCAIPTKDKIPSEINYTSRLTEVMALCQGGVPTLLLTLACYCGDNTLWHFDPTVIPFPSFLHKCFVLQTRTASLNDHASCCFRFQLSRWIFEKYR